MNIEEIKKNKPDGAEYWARLYETIEYLRCENKEWKWWNGEKWLWCSENTVKKLKIKPL